MILYSKNQLKIAEIHFNEVATPPAVDIIRYHWRPEKIDGTHTYPFHTILIDLTQDPELLLAEMNKVTRNEIRRAERENVVAELITSPGADVTREFVTFYQDFARLKGLPPLNRERVSGMRDSGALTLSRAFDPEGNAIVWHCYVHSPGYSRLLHSASLFRSSNDKAQISAISRANRYLHWRDMLGLRDLQVTTYDLGGWYEGKDDTEKLKINFFKEGFGGKVAGLFNTDHGVTFKGTIAIRLRRAVAHLREHKFRGHK
jgi:hypothetical protein